jgi:hypothetical protein
METERREFLKVAGAAAATAALVACEPKGAGTRSADGPRNVDFDVATLTAVAEVALPGEIGADGRARAVAGFVAWANGYAPAAEEMHGYGYPDIRKLPADPAPAWRDQLVALDAASATAHHVRFSAATVPQLHALLSAALAGEQEADLPSPLHARHIVVALLSHWASSPDGWDLAFEARIRRDSCRLLDDAPRKPLPLAPQRLS